uniref:Cytochrome c biogenesis protein transmembrane region n=1 Tax=Ahnfeltia plicata TaxID=28023 RepID=A0A1C9CB53_9FLOR|nr:cytochrome c biogenesis protein transmembrane region [Ahnfeltia plicata]AOM65618.1 cytochrome c biogenesis protein transmembrane region [Ahnfeltia plicata]
MQLNTLMPELKLYFLEQNINEFLYGHAGNITPFLIILIFLGGILTSFNPCFLATITLSVSYIKAQQDRKIRQIAFIAGLLSSLISIILLTSLFREKYSSLVLVLPVISSLFTIFIGLNLLQIIRIDGLEVNFEEVQGLRIDHRAQDYLIGFALGLSLSPCSTPILMTLLFWFSNTKNIILGCFYIIIYLMGYILPIIFIFIFSLQYNHMQAVTKVWDITIPITGSLVLGFGTFSLLAKIFT